MDQDLSASEQQQISSTFLTTGQSNVKSLITSNKGKGLSGYWKKVVDNLIPVIKSTKAVSSLIDLFIFKDFIKGDK